MKQIVSVNGPVQVDDIGFTQCHEHLLISKGISQTINAALCMDDIEKSCQELQLYRDSGGYMIIDAQPVGCNRMAVGLHEISERSGVKVIASTGFHKLLFYSSDHWIKYFSWQDIRKIFNEELSVGMFEGADDEVPDRQVPFRAGIVKAAFDQEGLSYVYQKLFRAAVYAAMDNCVPLMVHIEKGGRPEKLLQFLIAEGMDARHLIFCHMDRSVEPIGYYTSIMDCGVTMEFDTIGRFKYHSDEAEIKLISDLFNLGYKQILCSLDTTSERLKSYHPQGIGLDYLLKTFYPMLLKNGFSDEKIKKIAVDNVKQLFSYKDL